MARRPNTRRAILHAQVIASTVLRSTARASLSIGQMRAKNNLEKKVARLENKLALERARADKVKRQLELERVAAKQKLVEGSRERMKLKRIIKAHSDDTSEPFRFSFKSSAAENTAKSSLINAATKIANNYMTIPLLNSWLKQFGVTTTRIKQVILKFEDPYDTFKSWRMSERYAHSWIFPDQLSIIFFDLNLLSRYEALYGIAGPEAEAERSRIEVLFGWKLIHEVVHLGFRWKNAA